MFVRVSLKTIGFDMKTGSSSSASFIYNSLVSEAGSDENTFLCVCTFHCHQLLTELFCLLSRDMLDLFKVDSHQSHSE